MLEYFGLKKSNPLIRISGEENRHSNLTHVSVLGHPQRTRHRLNESAELSNMLSQVIACVA